MSQLVLIRHGQASMFAADYDKLSPVGATQAYRLGEFWHRRRVVFDEVYTGPRERQRRTAELVGAAYREAGGHWPVPVVIDELDEYDGDGILRECLPLLIERDARIQSLAEAARRFNDGPERYKHFQRMFEALIALWHQGAVEASGVETWRSFHARVERGLRRIMAGEASGRRLAVFTSGGPISIAVQLATKAPEATALELNWRIRNCSLTELVFTGPRVTLDAFNMIPHLEEAALWTYR